MYELNVYIVPKGTPHTGPDGIESASRVGHMFYTISDGVNPIQSFGFAPIQSEAFGPGRVYVNDITAYNMSHALANGGYRQTIEISLDQYNKLLQFGNKNWGQVFHYHIPS